MAAPTNAALVKKVLANSEPSTHGPKRTSYYRAGMSASGGKADISWRRANVNEMSAFDPKRTWQLIFTALHNSLDATD